MTRRTCPWWPVRHGTADMRLRHLIRTRTAAKSNRPTPATLATLATERPQTPRTVATVATVARDRLLDPLPALMRRATVDGVQLETAASVLESLMAAGAIDVALRLGWDARELIGLSRFLPHDHLARAGLIYSVRPGEAVQDVSRAGCVIAYANVRHLWRRCPIDTSIVLPWDLAAWLSERGSYAA